MTIEAASLNNPDPANLQYTTIYTVQNNDCLWKIAQHIVLAEAAAEGQKAPTGRDLNIATAKELAVIEKANPQIVGSRGSGTYDLIYAGDKIAIPIQTPGSATSFPAPQTPLKPGAAGFDPPGPPGDPAAAQYPGQDILSSNGNYDLVLLDNGDLVLYELHQTGSRGDNYSGDKVVWQSGTIGKQVAYVSQSGGNLDIHYSDGTPTQSMPLPPEMTST